MKLGTCAKRAKANTQSSFAAREAGNRLALTPSRSSNLASVPRGAVHSASLHHSFTGATTPIRQCASARSDALARPVRGEVKSVPPVRAVAAAARRGVSHTRTHYTTLRAPNIDLIFARATPWPVGHKCLVRVFIFEPRSTFFRGCATHSRLPPSLPHSRSSR